MFYSSDSKSLNFPKPVLKFGRIAHEKEKPPYQKTQREKSKVT